VVVAFDAYYYPGVLDYLRMCACVNRVFISGNSYAKGDYTCYYPDGEGHCVVTSDPSTVVNSVTDNLHGAYTHPNFDLGGTIVT